MNSSLIGKIDKAKRYQQEPERIQFQSLSVTFNGENHEHEVSLKDNEWSCNCGFFPHNGTCSHVMAMQRILSPMLSADARYGPEQPHLDLSGNEAPLGAGMK
ncbi:MAG: SWIM zinc finger family protein [Chloroflexia bacterium]